MSSCCLVCGNSNDDHMSSWLIKMTNSITWVLLIDTVGTNNNLYNITVYMLHSGHWGLSLLHDNECTIWHCVSVVGIIGYRLIVQHALQFTAGILLT